MYMIVRFYWQHDLDLIALCKHPDFDMQAWMKRAIIAYVRGTPLSIPNPPSQPYSVDLTDCSIHLTFSPYTEADVIEALTGFRLGFRNSAVKILFRHYLEKARLDPFYNDSTYRIKSRRKKRKSGGRKRREKPNTGTKGIGPDTDTSKEQKQQEVAAAQTSEPMKSKRSAHKTDSTNIRETEAEQRREPHIPEPIAKQEAHPRQESPDTEQFGFAGTSSNSSKTAPEDLQQGKRDISAQTVSKPVSGNPPVQHKMLNQPAVKPIENTQDQEDEFDLFVSVSKMFGQ